MLKRLLPYLSGLCVLLYAYGWYTDATYPAWVPLVWCMSCFVNDVYDAMQEAKDAE